MGRGGPWEPVPAVFVLEKREYPVDKYKADLGNVIACRERLVNAIRGRMWSK